VSRRRLAAVAAAAAAFGWALMTLGAFVRASGSGLACPDWPSCHGQLVAGGSHPLIEEVHRWLATALVIAVVGIAAAIFRRHRRTPGLIRPVVAALGLVTLQVGLGGVTVLLRNVSWTVVLHYAAAALLVGSIVLVAVRLASPPVTRAPRDTFTRLVRWFGAFSLLLLVAGSTVANTDSHTACGHDALLCGGSLLPGAEHHQVINFAHRLLALSLVLAAVWVARRARRERTRGNAIPRVAAGVAALYLIQAATGLVVMGMGDSVALDVIHSSLASLTWVAVALLLSLTFTLAPGAGSTPSTPTDTRPAAATRLPAATAAPT